MSRGELIAGRLRELLDEINQQGSVANSFSESEKSFVDCISDVREYIDVANEPGIAYELLVSMLEKHPVRLSGHAAVSLLELGLVFGYKTERPQDAAFDRRH